jgi:hypothetical protein
MMLYQPAAVMMLYQAYSCCNVLSGLQLLWCSSRPAAVMILYQTFNCCDPLSLQQNATVWCSIRPVAAMILYQFSSC